MIGTKDKEHPSPLQAGFARVDITPEPDVFLAGNGDFQSTGIHDPLYARALVLSEGDEWMAVVSADLLGVEFETVVRTREVLRAKGCPKPEHLLISCTHTHNGPHTRFSKRFALKYRNEAYLDWLCGQFAEAVMRADAARTPVSLRFGRGFAAENFNRRLIQPDGSALFYKPSTVEAHPELAACAFGVADQELDALQLVRPDGSVLVTAVHYAAHPLTLGVYRHVISADYCGALVRHLEQATGSDAVFFQGACGDLHPRGLFAGFERMEEMGGNLGREALRVLGGGAVESGTPQLRVARSDISLPTVLRRPERDEDAGKSEIWNPALFDGPYRSEMFALSMGPIAFVSAPGEILCEPALQIKCNSSFRQTWVLYNGNSYSSYIAHPRAYLEGGYEGDYGQCLSIEACPLVLATADRLLRAVAQG